MMRSPSSNSFGGANAAAAAAGLQGEKMCELIITGPGDTVDAARLRLLVMLDELVSLVFFLDSDLPRFLAIRVLAFPDGMHRYSGFMMPG